MDNHNSLLEFYLELYTHLHRDVAGATANVRTAEYERDIQTMERRAHSEGLSFFTKTLPRLGKAIDKALSTGGSLQFQSFKRKKGTQLPAFCWWLVSEIFDCSGRERSDASPVALKQLRQLLYLCYKLEVPYDEATNHKIIAQFRATEGDLDFHPSRLSGVELHIAEGARTIVRRVLAGLCPRRITPRHGPGVVATGERPWEKRQFRRLYRGLEAVYPFSEYMAYSPTHVADRYDVWQSDLEELEYGTAKVVLVPKDSRGPRLISCEPLELQWIQQGQMRAIVAHLEAHWMTRGHVNFRDQSINQQLAMQGSRDGSIATLDMKDASDRVTLELVRYLFPDNWVEALEASRSQATCLPDGHIVHMKKFAPMGSAVCFPVEALIFYALCVSTVMSTRNLSFVEAKDSIYVYGDDIICSSEDHATIRQYLPRFDLKVNDDKCCTAMTFKESCGCDAYKGVDVTPTKLRTVWYTRPVRKRNRRKRWLPNGIYRTLPEANCLGGSSLSGEVYASYVAYSNAMYEHGYYGAAEYLERCIQKIHKTPYFNTEAHDGIGFVRAHVIPKNANQALGLRSRMHSDYQVPVVWGARNRSSKMETSSCDWEEMLRIHSYRADSSLDPFDLTVVRSSESTFVSNPLPASSQLVQARQYAVPHSNSLRWGWISGN